jgi:hypothetical protein
LYDFPNPFQHSPARSLTITPLQELFVLNSPFIKQLSTALAKSVELEGDAATIDVKKQKFGVPPSGVGNPNNIVRSLYRKILSRDPTSVELKTGLGYLNNASVGQFAQVLLATNEVVFWP